jgi:hypothetical protein
MKGAALKTYSILLFFLGPQGGREFGDGSGHEASAGEDVDGPGALSARHVESVVAMGVAALILALLTRMALLSLADLSSERC